MNVAGKFLLLVLLTGCAKNSLSVRQMSMGVSSLASSFVGSPDPRQENPPKGEMLVVNWRVEDWILLEQPRLVLEVVLKNYEKRREEVEIYAPSGYLTYPVVGEEFEETKGILTYRALLIGETGEVFQSWQQQLWVDVLELDRE